MAKGFSLSEQRTGLRCWRPMLIMFIKRFKG